ncbi:MAG: hypothetical protein GY719_27810 [bacterium]|nr:hypothetical protein [bacterium]
MPISKPIRRISISTAVLLVASMAAAQEADPAFTPFEPFGKLQATLDDQIIDGAEVFFAERPGAYLLRAADLDQPLLIDVSTQRVERLRSTKVRDNGNGTVNLLIDAVSKTAGSFQVGTQQLTSTLDDGRRLSLHPLPDLLGEQTADLIRAHDFSYGYRARQYPPSEKALKMLRQETREVTVRVYFGSWCATCARFLPWLMQVEDGLEGSKIRFQYYGLARGLDDPEAKEKGIDSVPVAVVSVGGEELGRRSSQGLGIPENALLEILAGD